jgi:hypothetical protein
MNCTCPPALVGNHLIPGYYCSRSPWMAKYNRKSERYDKGKENKGGVKKQTNMKLFQTRNL